MCINKIKKIIFLGTGPSSGVPNLHCMCTNPCSNCLNTKNRRTNVSLLIETMTSPILIDCTKDFHVQYLRYVEGKTCTHLEYLCEMNKDVDENNNYIKLHHNDNKDESKNYGKENCYDKCLEHNIDNIDSNINYANDSNKKFNYINDINKKIDNTNDGNGSIINSNFNINNILNNVLLDKSVSDQKNEMKFYDNKNNITNNKQLCTCKNNNETMILENKNNLKNNTNLKSKTFRKMCSKNDTKLQNLFPTVILTHEHADAILGLDYLRQMVSKSHNTQLFSDKKTLNYLKSHFLYLFHDSIHNKEINGAMIPYELQIEQNNKINGLNIIPYHVEHGKNSTCLAFYIENYILYISDCSDFNTVIDLNVGILIVECTTMDQQAYGHSNYNDVKILIERIKPKITYLVGMSHLIDYDTFCNEVLQSKYKIIVAYDGLEIEFNDK
ncbi:hypothetical protein COBT_001557 [Conglomerata obtusa]